jgi:Spy/CpxP family protein refolding chaperone
MLDQQRPLSEAAKIAALEILALIQRSGDDDDIARQIATRVQDAITSAGDANVGVLRHLAHILTPAAMEAEGSGAAIVRTVEALRDAGIIYEP